MQMNDSKFVMDEKLMFLQVVKYVLIGTVIMMIVSSCSEYKIQSEIIDFKRAQLKCVKEI